ncbi:hypothetical protein CR161_02440 [Prosthecochloris sp. ZM]|uniref:transposase n=1 Tax=Prosthecochloris sp. ZM TaxID=2283143 RepID=UPI000DF7E7EF|nr:transposase [Prosthecochloris sp. ZM]RDD29655.1 hypothetical protein CR161_02440 [Prosthecochloris sp. ZM]
MPRGARLDSPGTLHHVMMRGIEKSLIFYDDHDRRMMLKKIGFLSKETGTPIYAFALMPNHVHLLLKSGAKGLPTFMRRLLSSYAMFFNSRHKRVGHVFQNRYKSIICEEDRYFHKLVAYINLNPLRGGLTDSLDTLIHYPWCSHGRIAFGTKSDWLERNYVLSSFGDTERAARRAYFQFMSEEFPYDRTNELNGGGLVRSKGGWSAVKSLRSQGKKIESDERILGCDLFVRKICQQAEAQVARQLPHNEKLEEALKTIEEYCSEANISLSHLRSGSRNDNLPMLRQELAKHLVNKIGLTLAETARQLGVTTSGVSKMLERCRRDH